MAEQIKNKALFDKAAQAFAKREYNQSITLFTMLIAEDPEDTLAWVSRGAAYMRLDNLDAALEDFNRAIGPRNKRVPRPSFRCRCRDNAEADSAGDFPLNLTSGTP